MSTERNPERGGMSPYGELLTQKLAGWEVEANRYAILTNVFQQHADKYRDQQTFYEHKIRDLRARMQEDAVEVEPEPPRIVDLVEALEASLAAAKAKRDQAS